MIDVQCRTVDTHQDFKSTGLDVECSLERGLICKASLGKQKKFCPDFEIRVLCECVAATHIPSGICDTKRPNQPHPKDCHNFYHCSDGMLGPELIEKSCGKDMMFNPESQVCDWPSTVISLRPECSAPTTETSETTTPIYDDSINEAFDGECLFGQEWSACAIECEKTCLYYDYVIKEKGKCDRGQVCDDGCVSAERRTSCPPGMLWRDENTCVQTADCSCKSHDGKPVKPGTVYKESECEFCQCMDNHYVCDRSACVAPLTAPPVDETEDVEWMTELVMSTTLSPPPECDPDLYIELVEADIPLGDQAFSASSVLTPAFAPSAARFSKKVNDK